MRRNTPSGQHRRGPLEVGKPAVRARSDEGEVDPLVLELVDCCDLGQIVRAGDERPHRRQVELDDPLVLAAWIGPDGLDGLE